MKTWNISFSDVANRHAPIKKTHIKGRKTPRMTSDLSNAVRDPDSQHRKIEAASHIFLKYSKSLRAQCKCNLLQVK